MFLSNVNCSPNYHAGRCSETCSSLQASIIKSYLSAYDTYKMNNNNNTNNNSNNNYSSISNNNGNNNNNMTSSISLQILKQLICSIDGQTNDSYDTSLDSNCNQNKNNNIDINEGNVFFSIDFCTLGDFHPLKLYAKEIFELMISVFQSINITNAREVMITKEKVAKMVYPDALSLDRTQTITSTYM